MRHSKLSASSASSPAALTLPRPPPTAFLSPPLSPRAPFTRCPTPSLPPSLYLRCDDTEFKNNFEKTGTFIRIYEDNSKGGGGGGGGRDRDRGRSRSR